MVDHVGLEWDDRCLSFHLTDRTVQTASRWQVRQPMNRSSVGRCSASIPRSHIKRQQSSASLAGAGEEQVPDVERSLYRISPRLGDSSPTVGSPGPGASLALSGTGEAVSGGDVPLPPWSSQCWRLFC